MNAEDAKLLLSYHSGRNPDVENPKWAGGFLGSLRPFRGSLMEENFHEVMACLQNILGCGGPAAAVGGMLPVDLHSAVGVDHDDVQPAVPIQIHQVDRRSFLDTRAHAVVDGDRCEVAVHQLRTRTGNDGCALQ